jgi:IS1 family transposase
MNKLNTARRAQIIACLCEGMSVRATCRLIGADKKTVLRLLVSVGKACLEHHDRTVRGLKSKRIQADELWSFCYAKEKNLPQEKRGQFGFGDVWTWTAMDADSKLMVSWFVGGRDAGAAYELMSDCASRLASRVQLTTDGHKAYLSAVEDVFGIGIDYAMLVKVFGENTKEENRKYSPAVCLGAEKHVVIGEPDKNHISTSYVERSNLSVRMHTRRFTRLTNAFSKKIENHVYAVALFFTFYNFARIHQTLRVTPAMEAGIATHVWTVEEIVGLVQEEDVVILR